jgi:drug/metabolite transporter (DMT)-like permease
MFKKFQYGILTIAILWLALLILVPVFFFTPLPCSTFNAAYISLGVAFLVSFILSCLAYKNQRFRKIDLLAPLFCLLIIFLIILGYHFGWIDIYEDLFRAVGKGPYEECEQFPLNLFIKNYL